jgi:hypothetical protein
MCCRAEIDKGTLILFGKWRYRNWRDNHLLFSLVIANEYPANAGDPMATSTETKLSARSKYHLSVTLVCADIHRRSRTSCPEGQLKHQCDPGEQPGTKILGEHRPIEHAGTSATGLYAFRIGELRMPGFVRELGFTYAQVDCVGLSEQTEKENTRKPKSSCGKAVRHPWLAH